MLQWWNDPVAMLFIVCPIIAFVLGMSFGVLTRIRWLGASAGLTMAAVPIVVFQIERVVGYMGLYAIMGLAGSWLWVALISYAGRLGTGTGRAGHRRSDEVAT
jgi:hypothetical protein